MSHCFSKSDIFYSEYFAYGRSSITIWAVPLTLITWVGLSHLPICYYLDLPTHPNYTGWALVKVVLKGNGSEGLRPQLVRCAPFPSIAPYLLRSCSKVTDPKGFGLSSYAVPLSRV